MSKAAAEFYTSGRPVLQGISARQAQKTVNHEVPRRLNSWAFPSCDFVSFVVKGFSLLESNGGPGGARTPNPQFRRLMLYPIELQGRDASACGVGRHAGWNRATFRIRREGLTKIWGGKRESNPQPSEPQSGALPVELFPPLALIIPTAVAGCWRTG